ncbi:hypothetical protein HNQ59_001760 [Chitinivorax tropicus]|uniref:Lipoprotein n=1 Tax=Chitinivorax tropicus TaxID=714531 RepID=A0A840MTD6_9PROT|nr:hypothetical protein [Chitinivorax tropicus]MBB5018471.1 hypothetical protein [Chitinivorax tropicus]
MKIKLLMLAVAAVSLNLAQAAPSCQTLFGGVQMLPDPACKIAQEYPGNLYLGMQGAPNSCFSIKLSNLGDGFAGLTLEQMVGANQARSMTPGALNEREAPPMPSPMPQTRLLFTGRTIIKTADGNLFGAEAGAMGTTGATEQSLIVGGTGKYAGATGTIYAYGDYIGNGKWGIYVGELCVGAKQR